MKSLKRLLILLLIPVLLCACAPTQYPSAPTTPPTQVQTRPSTIEPPTETSGSLEPEEPEWKPLSFEGVGALCDICPYKDGYLLLTHTGLHYLDKNFALAECDDELVRTCNKIFDPQELWTEYSLSQLRNYSEDATRELEELTITENDIYFVGRRIRAIYRNGEVYVKLDEYLYPSMLQQIPNRKIMLLAEGETLYAYFSGKTEDKCGNVLLAVKDGEVTVLHKSLVEPGRNLCAIVPLGGKNYALFADFDEIDGDNVFSIGFSQFGRSWRGGGANYRLYELSDGTLAEKESIDASGLYNLELATDDEEGLLLFDAISKTLLRTADCKTFDFYEQSDMPHIPTNGYASSSTPSFTNEYAAVRALGDGKIAFLTENFRTSTNEWVPHYLFVTEPKSVATGEVFLLRVGYCEEDAAYNEIGHLRALTSKIYEDLPGVTVRVVTYDTAQEMLDAARAGKLDLICALKSDALYTAAQEGLLCDLGETNPELFAEGALPNACRSTYLVDGKNYFVPALMTLRASFATLHGFTLWEISEDETQPEAHLKGTLTLADLNKAASKEVYTVDGYLLYGQKEILKLLLPAFLRGAADESGKITLDETSLKTLLDFCGKFNPSPSYAKELRSSLTTSQIPLLLTAEKEYDSVQPLYTLLRSGSSDAKNCMPLISDEMNLMACAMQGKVFYGIVKGGHSQNAAKVLQTLLSQARYYPNAADDSVYSSVRKLSAFPVHEKALEEFLETVTAGYAVRSARAVLIQTVLECAKNAARFDATNYDELISDLMPLLQKSFEEETNLSSLTKQAQALIDDFYAG